MKKLLGVMLAAVVCSTVALPAFAVENEFGGYWRTRGISMQDFDGTDSGTRSYVDTRTRLYYTAKFSDKFKFVNKFEIDTSWGDTDGGDIGADGKGIQAFNSTSLTSKNAGSGIEIKNSFADFSIADTNFKIGMQPGKIARGFLFDDDFSGLTVTSKMGSTTVPFIWMKVEEDDLMGGTPNTTRLKITDSAVATTDRDYFIVAPVFNLNETLSLNPYVFFDKQQKKYSDGSDTDQFFIGLDINAKVDKTIAWSTLIYQTGERDVYTGSSKKSMDIEAYLVAAGADTGIVHGQVFLASGDDSSTDDEKNDFGLFHAVGKGQTYYWSEIMGEGLFDATRSKNAPGTKISNVMAANVGVTVKPMDKLTLTGDLWYAQLAEEVSMAHANGPATMEDELGIEIDLKATYMVLDNLKLDVVAAYLMAGDATGEEDPIEIGTQLSFSF